MGFQEHKEHSDVEEMDKRSYLKSWRIEPQRLIKLVQNLGSKIWLSVQGICDEIQVGNSWGMNHIFHTLDHTHFEVFWSKIM